MLELGQMKEAHQALSLLKSNNSARILKAQYCFNINQFKRSESLVDSVLEGSRNNVSALNLKAELWIEKWNLKESENLLVELSGKNPKLSFSKYLLGLTYLLEGKFKELQIQIEQIKTEFPDQAWSELLLGRFQLIKNEPIKGDSTFKSGLLKSPLNADLRFYYGNTQWRNARGNFLERMDAQWNICLQINPLHYLAHWHLGNGHTLNTYFNYKEKSDSSVLEELKEFDKKIKQKKYSEALSLANIVHKKYPTSVIPLVYKASAYYMDTLGNAMDLLDSAEALYLNALEIKKHYGPAENGLAAVIKAKREPFLYFYDSIQHKLKEIPNSDLKGMESVIPEAHYYPSFVERMARHQFFSASAYFPILNRGKYLFHIIPLHHTLAETFQDPFFNQSTTFDFRQWMDI